MLRRSCGDVIVLVLLLGEMGIDAAEGGLGEMGELTLERGDDIINVDEDDE